MIHLHDISLGYHGRLLLEHYSAHFVRGCLTCIIGRNGVGKSTLLRTIAGLQRPLAGRVEFSLTLPMERLVSMVLTERLEVENLSARELVAMGRIPYTNFFGRLTADDEAVVDESMRMTDTLLLGARQVATLSDGERQKVMIARALAQQTPVILLDEPTAFLDYPSKEETMLMLRRLCHEQGKTVVMSTHDVDVARRTGDVMEVIGDEKWVKQDVKKV